MWAYLPSLNCCQPLGIAHAEVSRYSFTSSFFVRAVQSILDFGKYHIFAHTPVNRYFVVLTTFAHSWHKKRPAKSADRMK